MLRNPTGGTLNPVIDGDGSSLWFIPGVGKKSVASGLTFAITAGQTRVIPLDTIESVLQGTITITGGDWPSSSPRRRSFRHQLRRPRTMAKITNNENTVLRLATGHSVAPGATLVTTNSVLRAPDNEGRLLGAAKAGQVTLEFDAEDLGDGRPPVVLEVTVSDGAAAVKATLDNLRESGSLPAPTNPPSTPNKAPKGAV